MSELGEVLKKAREEKGLSLDDIQEVTKIRKRYLEALENSEYNVLPGKFYIRAFIKNYAEAVGLDSDEVLRYYLDEVPETETYTSEVIPARKPRRMRSAPSEKFGKIGFTLLMWCFLILIAFVIWYFAMNKEAAPANERDHASMTNDADISHMTTPTPTPQEPTPTPTPTVAPVSVTFVEQSGKDDVFSISPAKDVYALKLVASSGASWIEVYEGGKNGTRLYYDNLKDGETITYDVSKDVYLVVGRPGYIEVTVDDIVVEDGDNNKTAKRILLKPELAQDNQTAAE